MPLLNEQEAVGLKKYKVLGVPEKFNSAIMYGNDVYLPISAFNLTRANIISYMIETNSGDAVVGNDGIVYLSGQTAIDMCSQAQPEQVQELEECMGRLYEKILEAELIQFPVNQKLL